MTKVLLLLTLSAIAGHLVGRILGAKAFWYRNNGSPAKGGAIFLTFIVTVCLFNGGVIYLVLASDYLFHALALALVATYISLFGFFVGPMLK